MHYILTSASPLSTLPVSSPSFLYQNELLSFHKQKNSRPLRNIYQYDLTRYKNTGQKPSYDRRHLQPSRKERVLSTGRGVRDTPHSHHREFKNSLKYCYNSTVLLLVILSSKWWKRGPEKVELLDTIGFVNTKRVGSLNPEVDTDPPAGWF